MYAFSFISIYFFFPPSYFCYFRISIAKLFRTMYDTLGKIFGDFLFRIPFLFPRIFSQEPSFIMLKAFYLLYDCWIMLWDFGTLKDQLLGNFFVCLFGEIAVVKAFLGIRVIKGVGGVEKFCYRFLPNQYRLSWLSWNLLWNYRSFIFVLQVWMFKCWRKMVNIRKLGGA